MNEWFHIAISTFGSVVASLLSILFHDLRDRLVRLESQVKENGEDIARLEGKLDRRQR